jgi:membrane protease YdiL (CAAX protease family)
MANSKNADAILVDESKPREMGTFAVLIDIAIVVVVSILALVLGDWLRSYGWLDFGEASRGFLAVIAGAIAAVVLTFARGGTFADLGFRRPKNWLTVPLWAIGIFVAYVVFQGVGVVVVSQFVEIPQPDLSRFEPYHGNLMAAVMLVLILPFTASIPEEIIYRGFLMGRLSNIFGTTTWGNVITIGIQSLAFGSIHFQWGVGGIVVTAIMGMVWGTAYILCGRNLWITIIAHSFGHLMMGLQLYLSPVVETVN